MRLIYHQINTLSNGSLHYCSRKNHAFFPFTVCNKTELESIILNDQIILARKIIGCRKKVFTGFFYLFALQFPFSA